MKASMAIAGEASLSQGGFDEGIGRLERLLAPRPKDRSLRKPIPASGIVPAAGPLVLDFSGPASGTLMVPLWLTVTGGDDHTVVASSSVAFYLGGEAPSNGLFTLPPLTNLLVPGSTATAIPFGMQISSKDTVYAHFGDSMFLIVYGAAPGTNISAVLRVREIHPSNVEELNFLE